MRFLFRDTALTRHVYARDTIDTLIRLADFGGSEAAWGDASKCLVNLAIRAMEIERDTASNEPTLVLVGLREAGAGAVTLKALEQAVNSQGKDSDAVCVLCRLLNLMLWDEAIVAALDGDALVRLLLSLLEHCVDTLEKPGDADEAVSARRFSIAGDALRVFFQLTQQYGPLNRKRATAAAAYPITSESAKLEEDDKETMPPHIHVLFNSTMGLLNRLLLFDFHDARKAQLQQACMTFALNLPKEQVLKFDAYKVLPYLMDICEHHLTQNDVAASTTILMLFTKIARDEPRTRAIFMMKMFPRWKEVFEADQGEGVRMPEQHEGTPGKLVIDAMQKSDAGLHFFANEFVFLLCNENAGAFTKFCGFGPAAGHLAVRGLMSLPGGGGDQHQNPVGERRVVTGASEGEALAERGERVTNWKEKKIENPDLSGMSPEDVEEWNELCDKMERLDKLGVIKMVKDPSNSNNEKK